MVYDLQKAGLWKRISAWMFDGILLLMLTAGAAWLLSGVLGYDAHSQALDDAYARYESNFGVSFSMDEETYNALSPQEQQQYTAAYEALIADEDAMYEYNLVVNLTLVILTLGILLAMLLLEFLVPVLLGDGQTLGKKIFGLCLVRTDGVRVTRLQLLLRTLLGKFTLETMIPVYILVLFFWGTLNLWGTVILLGLLLAQILCLGLSKTNAALHDLLAGTAVVDRESQMIFATAQERLAYVKRVAAERAAKEPY